MIPPSAMAAPTSSTYRVAAPKTLRSHGGAGARAAARAGTAARAAAAAPGWRPPPTRTRPVPVAPGPAVAHVLVLPVAPERRAREPDLGTPGLVEQKDVPRGSAHVRFVETHQPRGAVGRVERPRGRALPEHRPPAARVGRAQPAVVRRAERLARRLAVRARRPPARALISVGVLARGAERDALVRGAR